MGNRGNLVIRHAGRTFVGYDHYAAEYAFGRVIWGLLGSPFSAAKAGCSALGTTWDHSLMDETWCEGAVAVDMDAKRVVVFGGDGDAFRIGREPWLGRVTMDLVRTMHQRHAPEPWSIEWADEGMATIADVAGVPRSEVMSLSAEAAFEQVDGSYVRVSVGACSLVTVRDEVGTLHDVVLDPRRMLEHLRQGPETVCNNARALSATDLPSEQRVRNGAFVDMHEHILYVWTACPIEVASRLGKRWPGWRVRPLSGAYLAQVALSGRNPGAVRVPHETVVRELVSYLPLLTGYNAGNCLRGGRLCECGYGLSYDELSCDEISRWTEEGISWRSSDEWASELGPSSLEMLVRRAVEDAAPFAGFVSKSAGGEWVCKRADHRGAHADSAGRHEVARLLLQFAHWALEEAEDLDAAVREAVDLCIEEAELRDPATDLSLTGRLSAVPRQVWEALASAAALTDRTDLVQRFESRILQSPAL